MDLSEGSKVTSAIRVAILVIFTSLVCVSTMVFSIYVPQTRGFFNIGETMVYVTALLFGPFIGSIAGGVGSMFADIFLGYWYYAPATLVIKACEGGIVGFLSIKKPKFRSKIQWTALTLAVGLIAGFLLTYIGSSFYTGLVELYLGFPTPTSPTVVLLVSPEFWYALGILVVVLIALMGFAFEPEFGWLVLTTLAGGSVMVLGYFLYQQFFIGPLFGIEVIALAEIPINIGQMAVGIIVSIPVVRTVRRYFPSHKWP